MDYRKYEYNLPKKKQPVFGCFKGLVKVFMKKVKVVDLSESNGETCLFVGNHANKMGPFIYECFLPYYHVKWGAHEMLGNFTSRRDYLKDILYMKKNKMNKFKASLKANFEAIFSCFIYKGMKVIGTYKDAHMLETVKKTVKVLSADVPVMVYPENSDDGYKDELTEFHPGFVTVAEKYNRTNEKDIPVCPVYYYKKKSIIVIGKKYRLSSLVGKTREEIAEFFKERVNDLYRRIVGGEFDAC